MKKYSIFVLWALLAVACGGGDDDSSEINIRKDKITISDRIDLLGDNDTKEEPISATCDWVITEDVDWLTITPRQGNKNTKTISVSATRNTSGVVRTGLFFISGGDAQTIRVTVTQAKYSENEDPTSSGEPSAGDNQPPT